VLEAAVHPVGREVELVADTVVVAAGVYGSPPILLRSGIGAEEELRRLGIRVVAALPVVGANLVDHLGAGVGWEATDLCRPRPRGTTRAGCCFEGATLIEARSSWCEDDS
jgi:choline dehydrogenase